MVGREARSGYVRNADELRDQRTALALRKTCILVSLNATDYSGFGSMS